MQAIITYAIGLIAMFYIVRGVWRSIKRRGAGSCTTCEGCKSKGSCNSSK